VCPQLLPAKTPGAQVIILRGGASGDMIQPANLMTFASAPRLAIVSLKNVKLSKHYESNLPATIGSE
jgi:hypothetical protein